EASRGSSPRKPHDVWCTSWADPLPAPPMTCISRLPPGQYTLERPPCRAAMIGGRAGAYASTPHPAWMSPSHHFGYAGLFMDGGIRLHGLSNKPITLLGRCCASLSASGVSTMERFAKIRGVGIDGRSLGIFTGSAFLQPLELSWIIRLWYLS